MKIPCAFRDRIDRQLVPFIGWLEQSKGHGCMRWRRLIYGIVLMLLVIIPTLGKTAPDIDIKGSDRFTHQVYQALDILKKKAPWAYSIVSSYVGRIEQGERSGMWAYKKPPTFEMGDRTTFYSVTWCAGAIAHDSFHSKLYHDYLKTHPGRVPDEVWTGVEAEKKCLKHQLDVLKSIQAPKHELSYMYTLDGTHNDVNKDGQYDWRDYNDRNW